MQISHARGASKQRKIDIPHQLLVQRSCAPAAPFPNPSNGRRPRMRRDRPRKLPHTRYMDCPHDAVPQSYLSAVNSRRGGSSRCVLGCWRTTAHLCRTGSAWLLWLHSFSFSSSFNFSRRSVGLEGHSRCIFVLISFPDIGIAVSVQIEWRRLWSRAY
jgi:hypothetical protein